MSFVTTCDYCGREIKPGDAWAMITTESRGMENLRKRERWEGGYAGHYHARRNYDCYWKIDEAIRLVHEYAPTLETIPTATGQSIAAKRRKHRREDES